MTDEPAPTISVSTDPARHRVTIRAQGQWALADAQAWYDGMDRVCGWARETRVPISILANCDGLVVHTQEVSRKVEETLTLMRQLPIARYVLIVPSPLMRMQCRRLLAEIDHLYADDLDEAKRLLGWDRKDRLAA